MLRDRGLLACSIVALLATQAVAQEAKAPAASFLSAAEVDPSRLLPPPAADGSPIAKSELAELHVMETVRTPAELAHAGADDRTKDATIFADAMGPGFDLKALPATARLMADVRHEEKVAADLAKAHFARKRPWIVDDSLKSCSREDEPLSSYPSGHTTMGFSMAVVLADLAPEHAEAVMARAADYGRSRMVCGMHFHSDVVAGQALGTAIGIELLRNSAFLAHRAAAAAELKAAGLTR